MMTACAGAFAADQFLFQLGKRKGSQYLANKPGWQLKVDKIRRFLETYQVIAILTYRFIYGMRTITPVIIGASRFSTRRFIFLNLCATMLWALLVSMGGYFFGHMLERFLQNVRRYEYATIISIVVVAGVVWLWQIRPQQK